MSRDVKIMLAGIIALLIFGAILYYRQSEILKRQGELDRKMDRNPFVEPGTNAP